MSRKNIILSLLGVLLLVLPAEAAPWARFRGPNGTGIANDQDLPVQFDEKNGIVWKVPIIGLGHSSPVVWDSHLFLQTATPDGSQRLLLCLDTATGKEKWSRSLPGKKAPKNPLNSLASSTPATDGEAVFVSYWDGRDIFIVAYSYKGDVLWNKNLGGPFISQHGAGVSPIVYQDKVFYVKDMDLLDANKKPVTNPSTLLALNKKTGEILWQVPRQAVRASYPTPFILEKDGTGQLIVASTSAITSYNPETGAENWQWHWTFAKSPLRMVASSIVTQDTLFAFSGDGGGERKMFAIALEGTGTQITPKNAWTKNKDIPYVPCSLGLGEHLYFVNDKGTAACFVAKTGQEVWTQRLPGAKAFFASPVLVDGKIYACSDEGEVFVFAAQPTFQLLATNPLGEHIRATPAVADGRLFIRGQDHLFCVSKKK